jgi:light-regulated signal transduction histidine kinase (bacteriophytochrome)
MAADAETVQVLVVDDHHETLQAIKALLEAPDRAIVTATSGEEALRCLLNGEYAVVLLDVIMPGLDGYETASLIRAREKTRNVPIIFLTSGNREVEQIAKGYAQGAVDYIFKPCIAEILRSKVTVFVELAKKSAALARRNVELEATKKELATRAEELARSNADLEQFAYAASHDLREPLRMVSSYVTLLANRYKDRLDDEANDFIDFAVRGVKRMETLVQDVLAYARVGNHRTFESVDCALVVRNAMARVQGAITVSDAEITVDPLPMVWGNESELTRVFQNLLANAIKFRRDVTPDIHISATRRAANDSTAPVVAQEGKPFTTDEQEWIFSVRDNGIGIESQYWGRIFLLFQRLHSSAEYDGSGVGLAICNKIIDVHGGRMWVESALGKGSTFYFTLPVCPLP